MRKLTSWANTHPWTARLIIIVANLCLYLGMMILAGVLQLLQVAIPLALSLALMISLSAAAVLLSIIKKRAGLSVKTNTGYWLVRAKYAMVLLASLMLVFSFYYYNWHVAVASQGNVYSSQPQGTAKPVKPDYQQYSNKDLFYKDYTTYANSLSRKELRSEYRHYRAMQKENQATGGDIALIILIILGALVLTYLLLALACSVSCAGSDAGAIAIAIVGLAGIIWGTIALIKGVKRRRLREAGQ